MHQPFVHYCLNELPTRHAQRVDIKRFGPGERIVFEPYSEDMYSTTQQWIRERNIFDKASLDQRTYENAALRV